MDETADYTCPHCGESIALSVDPSGGEAQAYIEDCPVCCNPNAITLRFDRTGSLEGVWAEAAQ